METIINGFRAIGNYNSEKDINMENMNTLRFRTSDDKVMDVPVKVIKCFETIYELMQDSGVEHDDNGDIIRIRDDEIIPIDVNYENLKEIVSLTLMILEEKYSSVKKLCEKLHEEQYFEEDINDDEDNTVWFHKLSKSLQEKLVELAKFYEDDVINGVQIKRRRICSIIVCCDYLGNSELNKALNLLIDCIKKNLNQENRAKIFHSITGEDGCITIIRNGKKNYIPHSKYNGDIEKAKSEIGKNDYLIDENYQNDDSDEKYVYYVSDGIEKTIPPYEIDYDNPLSFLREDDIKIEKNDNKFINDCHNFIDDILDNIEIKEE